jgi:hypothetical protein
MHCYLRLRALVSSGGLGSINVQFCICSSVNSQFPIHCISLRNVKLADCNYPTSKVRDA